MIENLKKKISVTGGALNASILAQALLALTKYNIIFARRVGDFFGRAGGIEC